MKHDRKRSIARLKRIEGQVRGLVKMMEEDRYCIDIIQQVQAAKGALDRVESEVLKEHLGTCVQEALESGDANEQLRTVGELVDLITKVKS
ncbi:MAG: metal-sensitive transcriptional regulator [Pseudomonadota bacterium]